MKTYPAIMAVPSQNLAKGVQPFLQDLESLPELPRDVVGFTVDGKPMFNGSVLFELKVTHGLPLDFALDRIINDLGMAVDWVAFIESARKHKWWDYQTYALITHSMTDAGISRELRESITSGFQAYVVTYPHPLM
jgi:alanyl-tRNA synthetase